MKNMINGYESSCRLVISRIHELTAEKERLSQTGRTDIIEEQQLDKRIQLLYTEHSQMQEIIAHLTAYLRRTDKIGKT